MTLRLKPLVLVSSIAIVAAAAAIGWVLGSGSWLWAVASVVAAAALVLGVMWAWARIMMVRNPAKHAEALWSNWQQIKAAGRENEKLLQNVLQSCIHLVEKGKLRTEMALSAYIDSTRLAMAAEDFGLAINHLTEAIEIGAELRRPPPERIANCRSLLDLLALWRRANPDDDSAAHRQLALWHICAATDEQGDESERRAAYRRYLDECELRGDNYQTIASRFRALSP